MTNIYTSIQQKLSTRYKCPSSEVDLCYKAVKEQQEKPSDEFLERLIERKLIVHLIKKDDRNLFSIIYRQLRDQFVYRAKKKFHCNMEDAKDIFQEALFALYKNVQEGRLKELSVDLKWYLYKIGDYKLINLVQRRKQGKHIEEVVHNETFGKSYHVDSNFNSIKIALTGMLNQLDYTSRQVLELYYFKGYCMEAIARELGFANAQVAKNKKSKTLKAILNNPELMARLNNIRS